MKIAIVGAGFTGLSAAFKLTKLNKHKVIVFEKENTLGGLATTFKEKDWRWSLEKHYHHWFTNDSKIISLVKELRLTNHLLSLRVSTGIYYQNNIYPFDSPVSVLRFPHLGFFERLRVGLILFYLKILPKRFAIYLEKTTAERWLKKWFGEKNFLILWQPLLKGKFGLDKKKVNMLWFWARIKKRTSTFYYLKEGYEKLINALASSIKSQGGEIITSCPFTKEQVKEFDKVIITTPSKIFLEMFPDLPQDYQNNFSKINHLHALNLILISKEKFLTDTYWLNINEVDFPFIGIIQHTNMIPKEYYGNKNITYIANYLPENHHYFKISLESLFKIYLPYLKKINPNFNFHDKQLKLRLFVGPYAQPIFPINYSRIKPNFNTPISNVYLANMDMVYPWDRGTNYAIELGEKVADFIIKN